MCSKRHKCLTGNINLSNVMGSLQGARHSLAGISLHFQTEFSDFKISMVGSEQEGWTHFLGPGHLLLKPSNLVFSVKSCRFHPSKKKKKRLHEKFACTRNTKPAGIKVAQLMEGACVKLYDSILRCRYFCNE